MKRIAITLSLVLVAALVLAVGNRRSGARESSAAPAARKAGLPRPNTQGGMPLMDALKKRQTSRQFGDRKLSDQVLSDLLWAAFGVNRPDGRRTAPSAVNWQEIDIYVAKADGLWLFDARIHDLTLVLDKDLRGLTGTQGFVKDAPVNLIFVADLARTARGGREADTMLTVFADTGFISQNVYLYCASEGLATVVRGLIDKPALARAMGLRDDQRIILAQSVGYPRSPTTAPGR